MRGWIIPPPRKPTKSRAEFDRERAEKAAWLTGQGYLRSERIRQALLKVPREDFIPAEYRDYAYLETPFPLPGEQATISCPHSYPLFYEPLGLDEGHRFLEVGTGSGYGAAIAREVVGSRGLVVSVEIDPSTLDFARGNLERAGYDDIVLVQGDGGLGHRQLGPYDCIAITAACKEIPAPLMEQLEPGGKLIAPIVKDVRGIQQLVLLEKGTRDAQKRSICEVLYVPLRGKYGS